MTNRQDTNLSTCEPQFQVFTPDTGHYAKNDGEREEHCQPERLDALQAALDALSARAASAKLQRLRSQIQQAELQFRACVQLIVRSMSRSHVANRADQLIPGDAPFGLRRRLAGEIARLKAEAQAVESAAKQKQHTVTPYST